MNKTRSHTYCISFLSKATKVDGGLSLFVCFWGLHLVKLEFMDDVC